MITIEQPIHHALIDICDRSSSTAQRIDGRNTLTMRWSWVDGSAFAHWTTAAPATR